MLAKNISRSEGAKVGDNELDNELTGKIINCFLKVYNNLGFGYLERVYENALKVELNLAGLMVEAQKPIQVIFNGVDVGDYFTDLFVGNKVIVEIKSVSKLTSEHESQLINYLVSTNTSIGLLLNLAPQPKIITKVFTPRTG